MSLTMVRRTTARTRQARSSHGRGPAVDVPTARAHAPDSFCPLPFRSQPSTSAPTPDVVTIAGRTRTWRVSPTHSSVATPSQLPVPLAHEGGGSDSEEHCGAVACLFAGGALSTGARDVRLHTVCGQRGN